MFVLPLGHGRSQSQDHIEQSYGQVVGRFRKLVLDTDFRHPLDQNATHLDCQERLIREGTMVVVVASSIVVADVVVRDGIVVVTTAPVVAVV